MDAAPSQIINNQPIKILLVEDNPADALLVKGMLQAQQAEAFELSHAENLTKGLQLLSEKKPHVVLLDLGLPECRGLETIKKVRPLVSDTPIVILADPEDEVVGMQAVHWGAQDFLIKWETTDTVLKRTIRYALERKRHMDTIVNIENKYRMIFDNMINGFVMYEVVYDENGTAKDVRYVDINPGFERMMGMKRQDVIGKTLLELFPKNDRKWIDIYAKIAKEGGSLRAERDRNDSGQYFESTIFNVQPNYVAVMFLDITEHKKAEIEVLKVNEELERHVKERTDKLVAANKELQTFGYTVSHDLRAPLRSIENFAKIVIEDYSDKLDDIGKNHLEVIRRSAEHMKELIDNLLEFSRTGMEKMTLKQIDLGSMARVVFDAIRTAAPDRNINLVIKEMPLAKADELLIRQVLINLLSNAIKFTGKKSEAVIEFGGEQKENKNLYYIKDNGAGFKMEYAEKLFRIFQRLHKEDEFEGTGVGLAIVQRIIHMHGGDICAEGKVNEGATFHFTLPC